MDIQTKGGQKAALSLLQTENDVELGNFFSQLTSKTKSLFGPHPLTAVHAQTLCHALEADTADRYILTVQDKVIGYFILEHSMSEHEAKRYAEQGIQLASNKDLLFAPCITEEYQNQGCASQVMKELLHRYTGKVDSFVLMGGTQETNQLGIAFYKKFGFIAHGGYQTEVYNIDMRLVFPN